MHEFSLASALIERVEQHLPAGATLLRARVRAGAMQSIEPDAMQWAWRVGTQASRLDGAELELEIEPFTLTCPDCARQWESMNLYETCTCGCVRPQPGGSAAITLLSLTIDQPEIEEVCHD